MATKPKPPPSLESFLARNPEYIQALANLTQNYRTRANSLTFQQNQGALDYNQGLRGLAEAYTKAKQQNDNSFAARGLIGSGLFLGANNDLNNAQTQQVAATRMAYNNLLNRITADQLSNSSGYNKSKADLNAAGAKQFTAGTGKY